jgi:4-hydroxybenzoate polyprenyltransferase
MNTNNVLSEILRWLFTAAGAVAAILEPAFPYLLICTLMIFADCYTAWSLARRVRKAHPDKTSDDAKKFKSHHFGLVIVTVLKSWALIIMAYLMQVHICDGLPVDLTKVAAGAICFWQLWSILENESSCNGAKWAKVMQKILVDKTSRHFDIDLSGLTKDSDNGTAQ